MKRRALLAACLLIALLLCGCSSDKDTAGDAEVKDPPVAAAPAKLGANDVLRKMEESVFMAPATRLKLAHVIQIDFGGDDSGGI